MKNKKLVLILIIILALFTLASCGGSSPSGTEKDANSVKITDAHMTTNTDSDGKPVDTVTSYKTNASKFTVSAILKNAPNNTKIIFSWVYKGSEIKNSVLDSGNSAGGDCYFHGYLTNTKGWQEGEYAVYIYEQGKPSSGTVVHFTVVK